MSRPTRFLAASLIALLYAAPPVHAAQTSAVTSVKVVRPVALSKVQDLDFGMLSFAGFTATRTIRLSRTGTITCAADIVCSGTGKQARFNLTGTNKQSIAITYSGGTLSNGIDTIPFTADGPATITLTNSGAPGLNFDVGGSIVLSPSLVGGVYTGTMSVTADYE